jgi:hypothetical protein
MSRLLTDAILIAIPIVGGLVSVVLGAREVRALRKETGDSSRLTFHSQWRFRHSCAG